MPLSNRVSDDVPEDSEFGGLVASGPADLTEEPGFLSGLLDQPLAGLDSFGSEEIDAELDVVPSPPRNLGHDVLSRGTGQQRPNPDLTAVSSPATLMEDRIPPPEHLPAAGLDAHISTISAPESHRRMVRTQSVQRLGRCAPGTAPLVTGSLQFAGRYH